MKNADMPANPMFDAEAKPCIVRDSETENTETASGLTKREMFAMHAMQGLIAAGDYDKATEQEISQVSVSFADALLEELAK